MVKVKTEKLQVDAELGATRKRLLETTDGFGYETWHTLRKQKAQTSNEVLETECPVCMEEDGEHQAWCTASCSGGAHEHIHSDPTGQPMLPTAIHLD